MRTEEEQRKLALASGGKFLGRQDLPQPQDDPDKPRALIERDGSVWVNVMELANAVERHQGSADVVAWLRRMQEKSDELARQYL